jgi:phage tail-like protein
MSARGLIEGLPSPHPVGSALPALYRHDEQGFAQRFLSGFDDALAPLFCALDNFSAYLDPALAPADFLGWLGGWLGLMLDDTWTREQRRRLLERAGELFSWRGTVRGLSALIELTTGAIPEIVESGGVAWSTGPDHPPPGRAEPLLIVRVHATAPVGAGPGARTEGVDLRRLEALVAVARPAHVPFRVEVVG